MYHEEKLKKLRRLSNLYERASRLVHGMCRNEDMPVYDPDWQTELSTSFQEVMNEISTLKNELQQYVRGL